VIKDFGLKSDSGKLRQPKDGERVISPDEFAPFLQESLQILTYYTLP